ncbi:hypothetical protein SAMN05216312_1073 [Cohnella sp. OV330]|uniref:hypothetical protein n=1 Tax=Cohnella sp. OV330 TaxID=1855288 RepID=UPI0008E93F9A|nr:hypothetical protein [Cohnella sp. OV330]SFB39013.1 hypothetical protein SAMN05216312_1073 [Cohnella sp. OV330]
MNLEQGIEISVWVMSAVLLIGLIPPTRRREAVLSIVFMQFISWILSLVVVELHLLDYPQ